MVESVNRLFSRMDNPFMFREIPFLPVKSAEKNHGLRFTVDDERTGDELLAAGGRGRRALRLSNVYGPAVRAQIRDWLSAGQRGEALLWRGKKPTR
jgi:exodeoxyribonuclease V beta subunit